MADQRHVGFTAVTQGGLLKRGVPVAIQKERYERFMGVAEVFCGEIQIASPGVKIGQVVARDHQRGHAIFGSTGTWCVDQLARNGQRSPIAGECEHGLAFAFCKEGLARDGFPLRQARARRGRAIRDKTVSVLVHDEGSWLCTLCVGLSAFVLGLVNDNHYHLCLPVLRRLRACGYPDQFRIDAEADRQGCPGFVRECDAHRFDTLCQVSGERRQEYWRHLNLIRDVTVETVSRELEIVVTGSPGSAKPPGLKSFCAVYVDSK